MPSSTPSQEFLKASTGGDVPIVDPPSSSTSNTTMNANSPHLGGGVNSNSSGGASNSNTNVSAASLAQRRLMTMDINMLGASPPLMGASVETALPDFNGTAGGHGGTGPLASVEDDDSGPIEMPSDDDDDDTPPSVYQRSPSASGSPRTPHGSPLIRGANDVDSRGECSPRPPAIQVRSASVSASMHPMSSPSVGSAPPTGTGGWSSVPKPNVSTGPHPRNNFVVQYQQQHQQQNHPVSGSSSHFPPMAQRPAGGMRRAMSMEDISLRSPLQMSSATALVGRSTGTLSSFPSPNAGSSFTTNSSTKNSHSGSHGGPLVFAGPQTQFHQQQQHQQQQFNTSGAQAYGPHPQHHSYNQQYRGNVNGATNVPNSSSPVVATAVMGHRWQVSTSVSGSGNGGKHHLQQLSAPNCAQNYPLPAMYNGSRFMGARQQGGARSADDITLSWAGGGGTSSLYPSHLSNQNSAGSGSGHQPVQYHFNNNYDSGVSASVSNARSNRLSSRAASHHTTLASPKTDGAPSLTSSNNPNKKKNFVSNLVSNLLKDEEDEVDMLEKGRVKRRSGGKGNDNNNGGGGDEEGRGGGLMGHKRTTGRVLNIAEGMHSIPWDDRAISHGGGATGTSDCDCCKSRRFLWRIDWAMRCTFLSVLPCAIYGLVVSNQLNANSSARGRQFVLPGLAVVMSFWCSRHMLGDSLREVFSVLKGIIPAFIIAMICVAVAPQNRWTWLLFYLIALLVLASMTDTTRRPACFLTASTLAVYLLFIEGRLDMYRGQALSFITLSTPATSSNTTTIAVTPDVDYSFMVELLYDVLIGLGFGGVAMVLPWPNWSLKRSREYLTLLSSVTSMTTMGVTHSLWTTTVVDREAYLVRLRYFRQTYSEAMRVIDQSLCDSEFEPHYDRDLGAVRDKRDLLETLMNILHSTSHIIEVLSLERRELQTVGTADSALGSGDQKRNQYHPNAYFTPEGLTPLAQQNALSGDPTFEAFRVNLRDDLLQFAAVLDRFILQITDLRSVDELDVPEHKKELQMGLQLMQRSKKRFYEAVDHTRQTAIFNNPEYIPGKGDIIIGAFLFCIEEISEVLIAFTRHEIRKTRELSHVSKSHHNRKEDGFFGVGAGGRNGAHRHRGAHLPPAPTGFCHLLFNTDNGPLHFPYRMLRSCLYDFLSVFIVLRLNVEAMLITPRRLPRRVKEAIKMVVAMILSAICELYIIGYLDPISGGALIPWMCEFQQSTVVYRPKGKSTKHDEDDTVAAHRAQVQGMNQAAQADVSGEKNNQTDKASYEEKYKDNRTYTTTIYHGVYHIMLYRVLGTTSGSVIAYILAEYGVSLGLDYIGFLISLFICVFVGAFLQTSRNYSSAGSGFIWGSVTISTGFNSFREVAINRFTSNVVAVLIYFIICFLVWPENAQVNIRTAFDENLRAFRDATVTILLSIKSRRSAERTVLEEFEEKHGDGGSEDDEMFMADDYISESSSDVTISDEEDSEESYTSSTSGHTSDTDSDTDEEESDIITTSNGTTADGSSDTTARRRQSKTHTRRRSKRHPREPVSGGDVSVSSTNEGDDRTTNGGLIRGFVHSGGRLMGKLIHPSSLLGHSTSHYRRSSRREPSRTSRSKSVASMGSSPSRMHVPRTVSRLNDDDENGTAPGDLTETELRLTHFYRRQQLIRTSIAVLARTVQREEGLLPAATREPTLEALAFPSEEWRKVLASQRNLLHLLGLLRFTFVTFSMSTTDAEIAEGNRKNRRMQALRIGTVSGGASSMFEAPGQRSSKLFRDAVSGGAADASANSGISHSRSSRSKATAENASMGGALLQAGQDTSAVISQSIHWDILKALQRSATKIATELPSLIDLYLVSIKGESSVPTSQLVSKRLSIQAIQLEMESAYFETIIGYARRNMLDDVQQTLEDEATEVENAQKQQEQLMIQEQQQQQERLQQQQQDPMSGTFRSVGNSDGDINGPPALPNNTSPTSSPNVAEESSKSLYDLSQSSPAPATRSTSTTNNPPPPAVKKSLTSKWAAQPNSPAPSSQSILNTATGHFGGGMAGSPPSTNDSFFNNSAFGGALSGAGNPVSSETDDDDNQMAESSIGTKSSVLPLSRPSITGTKPPLGGRLPKFGATPNTVFDTTDDGGSQLGFDEASTTGPPALPSTATGASFGGPRTMTEIANDNPELAAALAHGMRGVTDANTSTTKGRLVETARAAMGKRHIHRKKAAEVDLVNLSYQVSNAGGLLELIQDLKADTAEANVAGADGGKDPSKISAAGIAVDSSDPTGGDKDTAGPGSLKGKKSRGGGGVTFEQSTGGSPPEGSKAASRSKAAANKTAKKQEQLQVLGAVIKNLVLASVDVHSIEAFLFGLRAVVAEIARLEAAILELRHADETARLLAS